MEGVVSDSRLAAPGSLFVALPGRRRDGHDFLVDAQRRGAVAALCERNRTVGAPGLAIVEGEDQLDALGLLARQVLRRSRARVVGIAGSAGKTSTKDILRALCAPHAPTIASKASYNNELGVPLTLCAIEPETRIAICELGTGAPGELAGLCRIAGPDIGIVTCAGPEHLAVFGSVENVVKEEGELIAALPPGGTAVIPWGDPQLSSRLPHDVTAFRFGLDPRADVHVVRWEPGPEGTAALISVRGARVRLRTNLRAPHHRLNLSAAVAAYVALGLPLSGIGKGTSRVELSALRDEERERSGGGLLINDSYNANPVSMRAAIGALASRRNGARTVAVLGEMAELGPESEAWHRRVGGLVAAARVDLLLAVGSLARGYRDGAGATVEGHWIPDLEAARRRLPELLRPGDVVLLKGSRSAGLERLVGELS
jgi:UDP-N-acetylmuramoyl-tripeptide--D-alanyl-D-alanine ligase